MLSSADWEDNIKINSFEVREIKEGMEWAIYFKDNEVEFPCSRILYDDRYYGEVWVYLNDSEWIKDKDLDVLILKLKVLAQSKLAQLKTKLLNNPGLSNLAIAHPNSTENIFDIFYSNIITQKADEHFFKYK